MIQNEYRCKNGHVMKESGPCRYPHCGERCKAEIADPTSQDNETETWDDVELLINFKAELLDPAMLEILKKYYAPPKRLVLNKK